MRCCRWLCGSRWCRWQLTSQSNGKNFVKSNLILHFNFCDFFIVTSRMINQIDPTCKAKKKAKERAVGLLKRWEFRKNRLNCIINKLFFQVGYQWRSLESIRVWNGHCCTPSRSRRHHSQLEGYRWIGQCHPGTEGKRRSSSQTQRNVPKLNLVSSSKRSFASWSTR